MSAYLPQDLNNLWLVIAVLGGTLLAGFAIGRIPSAGLARTAAWMLVVVATAGIERLCKAEPPGLRMLGIIAALFFGMKAVVTVEAQAAGQPRLSRLRWFGFAAGWPGMRPAIFRKEKGKPLPGAGSMIRFGMTWLVLGITLTLLARWVWINATAWLPEIGARIPATLLLLIGLSLLLHFGVFTILAGLWRLVGVDCRPLFRTPLLSKSLTDFWGRRWNLAFSEMTAIAIYRPLASRLGTQWVTAVAFLCSGVMHELAISVPVMAGFGLPFLYFALHGALVLCERKLDQLGRPIDRLGWPSRLWTLSWLAVPLPILFHPFFLNGVVWPLIGMARPANSAS